MQNLQDLNKKELEALFIEKSKRNVMYIEMNKHNDSKRARLQELQAIINALLE